MNKNDMNNLGVRISWAIIIGCFLIALAIFFSNRDLADIRYFFELH